MFSCPSITRSSSSVRRLFNVQRLSYRPFSNQSKRSTSSSTSPSSSSLYGGSSYGDNGGGRNSSSIFESILKSLPAGVVIVGSTLGFCYFSSALSDPKISYLAYADWPKDTSTEDFDNFKPQKKHKFIFGGNNFFFFFAEFLFGC